MTTTGAGVPLRSDSDYGRRLAPYWIPETARHALIYFNVGAASRCRYSGTRRDGHAIPDSGVGIVPFTIHIGHYGMGEYKTRRTLNFFNALCCSPAYPGIN